MTGLLDDFLISDRESVMRPRSTALFGIGLGLFAAALIALILVCYRFPDGYDSYFFAQDPAGMHQFQAHLGLLALTPLKYRLYSRALRLILLLLWGGYALTVFACLRGDRPSLHMLTAAIAGTAALTAIFLPPLFSTDVYANVAHGRVFVIYGQNPYLWKPSALLVRHDPVARFLSWNCPTVYGPVWTWIEIVAVALTRSSGVWGQALAQKLLLGMALLASAFAGRRLAARLSPGNEILAFLAIGLNPLLLIEGPGNGHNDLVFLSFLLFGAACYFEKKYVAAALLLGLSVGIKPITLALLPWVLLDYCRGRSVRETIVGMSLGTALVLLPLILFFAPLWAGPVTLNAMHQRAAFFQNHATLHRSFLALLYVALTIWLWKWRPTDGWLMAWAFFSVPLMYLLLVPPFPWYIIWFWPICLLRWNRWHLALSAACLGLSLLFVSEYALLALIKPQYIGQMWYNLDGTKSHTPER